MKTKKDYDYKLKRCLNMKFAGNLSENWGYKVRVASGYEPKYGLKVGLAETIEWFNGR